jgi:hypothetical protein
VYNGDWAFRRLTTLNGGANWNFMDDGIDPSGTWYHRIRNDKVYPVYLFNYSGKFVYRATGGYGSTWSKLNPNAFPEDVGNMSVSRFASPSATVYACLAPNTPVAGTKLRVYDGTSFSERSAGLPANNNVRYVAPHPTSPNIAYALINGWGAGERVYKTTNKGINWTNVTGNLPNIPVSSLIAHPTDNNKLYLGTEMGCYKTSNAGVEWMRWNNGMPNSINVQEMGYIDSISANGRFYVVAATYGRSIYHREISGDDPIAIEKKVMNIPDKFELVQNYPNPFNPSTTIKFLLPVNDKVTIDVFDITGKHIANIVNENLKAGTHEVVFDASGLSSGIYFYRMISSKLSETKKMILVK